MKTHYITTEKVELARSRGIAGILMMKGYCGAKATERASLDYTSNTAHVDCKRCIASMEKRNILA